MQYKTYELPCEECCKTSNHCCMADIPYTKRDIENVLNNLPEGFNKNDFFETNHKTHSFTGALMLIHKSYNGKDVNRHPCIFFKNGLCSIYDNRPDICLVYGTSAMRCRNECSGTTTKQEIEKQTTSDIKELDILSTEMSNKDHMFDYIKRIISENRKEDEV